MKVRRFYVATALTAAGLLLNGSAQSADAPAPKWYETTKISGFADAYYKFNGDGRKSATANTAEGVFDKHQNEFSVGGGKVEMSSMDGNAVVDLYFGDYAAALQGVAPATVGVGQAYIAQAMGPVTVTLGRYFTHLGYEVSDSVANLNFTRGLLYAAVPFYHQGLKLAYSPVEGLGLMAQLDNGNSTNYTTSNETAGGAQISYTGIKDLSLYLNYYYQPSTTLATWGEKMHYIDVVGSYGIKDGLTVAAEYLYFTNIANSEKNGNGNVTGSSMIDPSTGKKVPFSAKTQGYAVYVDYLTPMAGLSITPRFEALYAPDAAATNTGDAGLVKFDYTLTGRYVKGAYTNWLELRADASNNAIYLGAVNAGVIPNGSYTEMALTWGLGYKF